MINIFLGGVGWRYSYVEFARPYDDIWLVFAIWLDNSIEYDCFNCKRLAVLPPGLALLSYLITVLATTCSTGNLNYQNKHRRGGRPPTPGVLTFETVVIHVMFVTLSFLKCMVMYQGGRGRPGMISVLASTQGISFLQPTIKGAEGIP